LKYFFGIRRMGGRTIAVSRTTEAGTIVIKAAVGELVTVDLHAASGTGYRWQLAGDPPQGIELVDTKSTAADGPGGSGTESFHLRATRSGDYTVAFRLKRSWEAEPIDTKTVEIEVR
jgi:predicted secreted protein